MPCRRRCCCLLVRCSRRYSSEMRRPLFGRAGPFVVAAGCGWELVGLVSSHVPTVSQAVRRRPVLGVVLIGLLAHHWFVERS